MSQYGFLILHYMDYDMTAECVQCLLKTFGNTTDILIIDNGSTNQSGHKLKQQFQNVPGVHLLHTGSNLGFAKGNNLGREYFLRRDTEYLIVMNNDVYIQQADFLERIEEIHHQTAFDVLGPDIFSPRINDHQSPTKTDLPDLKTIDGQIEQYRKANKHFLSYYIRSKIQTLGKEKKPHTLWKTKREHVVLHGACYIFSRHFLENREYLFHPDTFLYMEEEILALECDRQGLKICYDPSLKVVHMEDVSTTYVYKTEYRRTKLKVRHKYHSLQVYKKIRES